jgi:hypothetical protein
MPGYRSGISTRCLVTTVSILTAASLPTSFAASSPPGTSHSALILGFSPPDRTTVRRAVDTAIRKLALPGCSDIYADFELAQGGTPRDALDRRGMTPAELLESLVFVEGSRERLCRTGPSALTMTPGSHVVSVCPQFVQLQLRNPGLAASLLIHESLHALGLGENPPSSSAITQQVERRCWKAAATAGSL